MNKSIIGIAAGLAGLLLSVSCDKLDEPYAVKKEGGDTTQVTRKVLLEDYTGHKCVNCPTAALAARVMEESLNGKLIVMAVHAGFFAEPSSSGDFTADYTTEAGNEWNTWFQIVANPNGLVNRIPYDGNVIVDPGDWLNAINDQLALPQEANIIIDNEFTPASRELKITLASKFMAPLEGAYTLTVCLTEDSLISPQKNSDTTIGYPVPIIYDWVFMDVLRGTVNGTWGEELTTSVDTSAVYTKTYTATLDTAWTEKNCHVVAFISRSDSKAIIQAEKKAVLE